MYASDEPILPTANAVEPLEAGSYIVEPAYAADTVRPMVGGSPIETVAVATPLL